MADPNWMETRKLLDFAYDSISRRLRASSKPFLYDIAEGHIPDHAQFRRFGHNADLGNTWETIFHGSAIYTYLTSEEILHVISSSAADTSDGTGARTLFIKGLDGDYNITSETITLLGDGTYAVTTDKFLRVFTAYVVTAGTGGTNAGNISIKNTAETTTIDTVPIGEGQLHSAIWTVPLGKKAFICDIYMSESTNKGVQFGLFIRTYGGAWRMYRSFIFSENVIHMPILLPFLFAAKTDIEIRGIGTAAEANVTAGFDGWYELA